MADADLEAVRKKRLEELKSQQKVQKGMAGIPGQSDPNAAEKEQQMEEMRRTMLAQIVSTEARERLSRISMVKPEKGKAVEDLILKMAQTGQIRAKISESQLIELLEQINSMTETTKKASVIVNRRRDFESDEEEYDL